MQNSRSVGGAKTVERTMPPPDGGGMIPTVLPILEQGMVPVEPTVESAVTLAGCRMVSSELMSVA